MLQIMGIVGVHASSLQPNLPRLGIMEPHSVKVLATGLRYMGKLGLSQKE